MENRGAICTILELVIFSSRNEAQSRAEKINRNQIAGEDMTREAILASSRNSHLPRLIQLDDLYLSVGGLTILRISGQPRGNY